MTGCDGDVTETAAAVRFTWSRPRRWACYYLASVGLMMVAGSPIAFAGTDKADFPDPVGAGLGLLFGGLAWAVFCIWLSRASVTADAAGVRSRALIARRIAPEDIVDIQVRTVPHGIYAPYPLAPYVLRRTGRAIKLTCMQRLDAGGNSAVLAQECQALLAALPRPVSGAAAQAAGDAHPALVQDSAGQTYVPAGTALATRTRRIAAFLISLAYAAVVVGLGLLVVPHAAATGPVWVALYLAYVVWGITLWGRGQTPGLRLVGLRVWHQRDQRVAGWPVMVVREVVGTAVESLLFPLTTLVSFGLFLAGQQRQSLHDILAGTIVLYDPDGVLAGSPAGQ